MMCMTLRILNFSLLKCFLWWIFFLLFYAHVWIYIYTNYNPMIYRLLILSILTIRVTQLTISLFYQLSVVKKLCYQILTSLLQKPRCCTSFTISVIAAAIPVCACWCCGNSWKSSCVPNMTYFYNRTTEATVNITSIILY